MAAPLNKSDYAPRWFCTAFAQTSSVGKASKKSAYGQAALGKLLSISWQISLHPRLGMNMAIGRQHQDRKVEAVTCARFTNGLSACSTMLEIRRGQKGAQVDPFP
jgi:hypothetical protein